MTDQYDLTHDVGGGNKKPKAPKDTTPPGTNPAPPTAPVVPPQAPTTPPPNTNASGTTLQNATNVIDQFMSTIPGLSNLDPTGILSSWVNQQVSTYWGQGMGNSDISNLIQSTMNNPQNDPAALAIFNQLFPGYNQKIQNGTTNANGEYTGLAGYIQYASQIQQFAQTASLIPGTVSAQDIGALWARNVSANEVSDRITMAASNANAAMSNGQVGTYLQSQGLNAGTLTSYYLNPTNALQSINSLNTGIAGAETGFGQMTQAQSQSLASFLANPGTNGVPAVTTQQAQQALTGTITSGTSGAAQMAQAGFENALPGQAAGGPGVISGDQLLGAVEGNAQDVAAAKLATGTRTAGTGGGGGAVNNQQGVAGIGYGAQ